jgi:hypothetical protein
MLHVKMRRYFVLYKKRRHVEVLVVLANLGVEKAKKAREKHIQLGKHIH